MSVVTNRSLRRASVGVAGLSLALLCGCSGVFTAPTSAVLTESSAGAMSGTIHGGQQPVYNASVRLYSMGTSGYGIGSTLLATTTTDVNGNFSFTKLGTNGTSAGSTSTWACPASAYDPQIYITSTGGNTQGTATTSTNNTAAVLMEAIGPCSALNSSTRVSLNEITTAASAFAFAQYMNPGTSAGAEVFGSSNTTQGLLGLSNAYATLNNLINIASGLPAGVVSRAGTAASVSGVTVTATSDYPKLVTTADILAACVNQTSATSTFYCADLFNNATAPTPGNTSQPSATFTSASDTLQAAYYLATNPGLTGAFSSCSNTSSTTSKAVCLFGLASANAPFSGGVTSAPTDYTMAVNYTASGTCTGGTGSFIGAPFHANVDASGNVWFINGTATNATIAEISPVGTPLFCSTATFTNGTSGSGRGLTIDVAGNVWGAFNSTTGSGIVEIPTGSSTVSTPVNAPANPPQAMTSDGFGNVFYTVPASGGTVSELVGAATATSFTPVSVSAAVNGTGTTNELYLQVDSNGRLWDSTQTVAKIFGLYPTSTNAVSSVATDGSKATFTTSASLASGFIVGASVQVSGFTSTLGKNFNSGTYAITAVGTNSFSVASSLSAGTSGAETGTAYIPGAYTATASTLPTNGYGVTIDSANNVYQGGTTGVGTGAASIFREVPASSTSASVTVTPGPSFLGGQNGARSLVVDGASNIFVGSLTPNSAGGTATAGSWSITENNYNTASSWVALSPTGTTPSACTGAGGCATTGGYFASNTTEAEPLDMEVDPSGNLWVMDTAAGGTTYTGTSITELVGVAVPVVTPLSVAVKNGQLGTKP